MTRILQAKVRRRVENEAIESFILNKLFSQSDFYPLKPWHWDDASDLTITHVLDRAVWDAGKDWTRPSTRDLPVEAWPAEVHQITREIMVFTKRVTSELVALQTMTIRDNPEGMQEVLGRMRLQIRGIELLMELEREAIQSEEYHSYIQAAESDDPLSDDSHL